MLKALREIDAIQDHQKQEALLHELTHQPDEVLEEISDVLTSPEKALRPIALRFVQILGSPRNVSFIPALLANVGNKNSLIWFECVQMLGAMGADAVLPSLLQFLWYRTYHQYWGDDVEGVCGMLQHNDQFALRCGPYLAIVLAEKDIPLKDLDKSYILDVFEKIGPHESLYVLPALIQFVQEEKDNDNRLQAWRLLNLYSQEALAPYALILAQLEKEFV